MKILVPVKRVVDYNVKVRVKSDGSGVWTTNVSKAHQVAKALRAGSVWVNCYQAMDPAVPFGGYKMSGYGRESGKQHVEEYLNVKAVWIKTA